MIEKNKDNAKFVSVVSTHLHVAIGELKQLNTHLDKINYLIYQHVSEAWTKDKQLKVLTELKNWTDK